MQSRVSAIPGVLTVEVELNTVSEGQTPPPPLNRSDSEKLGWSMAEDLRRILGEIDRFGLVTLGGLYDMTEILRPGLPLVDILMEIYRRSLPDTQFQPRLMTIGTQGDAFPIPEIAPRRTPGSGPLFVIPFLFIGEPEAMDDLSASMEKALLQKGQASAATGQLIQSAFGIRPLNLSYATFNDLCALLKIQLDQNGFGALWTLLDSALFQVDKPTRVQLPEGNLFVVAGQTVYTRYPGFSEWAERFSHGADLHAGYTDWHRLQRQFTAALGAHGLTVRIVPGTPESRAMETLDSASAVGLAQQSALPDSTDRFQEVLMDAGDLRDAREISILPHRLPGLGTVVFTISARDARGNLQFMANDYALTPDALNAIPETWRAVASEQGAVLREAHSTTLQYTGDPPRLATTADDHDSVRH